MLSGDAGVGKTTVVEVWLARQGAGREERLASGQCAVHGEHRRASGAAEAGGAVGMSFNLYRPYFLSLLAEAYTQAGQPEAGLTMLDEALTAVATTEERWWEAEVYRLKGELLLRLPLPDIPQATACLHQALDVARHQQARALELRAALSLSRLWQQQGELDQAQQVLTEVYGWFTEGFETPDLQEARRWLEAG